MTQSIIVYRNPIEATFWESGMVFPLMASLVVGFLTMFFLSWIATKFTKDWRGPSGFVVGAAAVVSICAGALTFHWLMI
jgi:hypothetical protein